MRKKNILLYVLYLLIFVFTNNCSIKNTTIGLTEQFYIQKNIKNEIGYLLYLPEDYYQSKDKKYPLIFFIHGTGDQGTNLLLVKRSTLPKMLAGKKDFPFIVVSPQYLLDKDYNTFSGISVNNFGEFFDHIIKKYKVDINKVYLTGSSFGGYLTWNIAIKNPLKFAAIAPLCGFGVIENLDKKHSLPDKLINIKKLPVWVFHGKKDKEVPIIQSEVIVSELIKYGSSVKFTVYPEAGHDCWTQTYSNQELYNWFLENEK